MASRKKATPAVDTNETIETKAVASETVAEDATAETTPVKKTRTRKTATKAAATEETKTTAKKTTTKKAASKKAAEEVAPKAEIFIEYGGVQVSVDEIISNAKKIVGDDKDIKIYVQPDTSKAYIAFGDESVAMDVFFC